MVIYGRDARIGPNTLKSLFSGKSGTTNRSSAIYELSLKCANKAGSPGMTTHILDSLDRKFNLIYSKVFNVVKDEFLIPAQLTFVAKKI